MNRPTLLDRIRELSLENGEERVQDYTRILYSWQATEAGAGHEEYEAELAQGGALHYSGVYHPDVVCEGNPCRFCGRAVMEVG